MDYKIALALSLSLALVGYGTAMALGKVVASAMEATGRQPEAANKILVSLTVGCAFIEAITIYVLVFVFSLLGKI